MAASTDELLCDQEPSHRARISEGNQKSSGFLRLPAELRNHIYELFAEGVTVQVIEPRRNANGSRHEHTKPHSRTLLSICRQIRNEATGIYYKHAVFDFSEVFDLNICFLRIPEVGVGECHCIQNIKIHWLAVYGLFRLPRSPEGALEPHPLSASLRSVDAAMPSWWYQNQLSTINNERKVHTKNLRQYFNAPALDVRFSGGAMPTPSRWMSEVR